MRQRSRTLGLLLRLLGGAQFPAFIIALLLLEVALAVFVLTAPLSGTALEGFARDFKIWCFGYDPERGSYVWAMIASFTAAPLLMAGLVLLVFFQPLAEAVRLSTLRLWPATVLAMLVMLGSSAGLLGVGEPQAATPLPFPAAALRTHYTAPTFALRDHTGAAFGTAELRNKVALVTAVYASCGTTCPMILSEAANAVASLTQHEQKAVEVVAITLDPVKDTEARLAEMAHNRKLDHPPFHLVTGAPEQVEATLDRFSIARTRNPKTGIIEHQNVFILIDIHGHIAYRLSPGPRQERWLGAALRELIREVDHTLIATASARP